MKLRIGLSTLSILLKLKKRNVSRATVKARDALTECFLKNISRNDVISKHHTTFVERTFRR